MEEEFLVTEMGEEPKTEPDNKTVTESVSIAQIMSAYTARINEKKGEE